MAIKSKNSPKSEKTTTPTKVSELTPNDIKLMQTVVDEWVEIGIRTGPPDRAVSEDAIQKIYKVSGYSPPQRIEWFLSPNAGVTRAAELTNNKKYSEINNAAYGQHDAYWLAFWNFFQRCESVEVDEIPGIEPLFTLAKQIGWWWPYDEVCIVTERPTELHRDAAGRLHFETGMALKYADDWGIYSWHGFRIPTSHHWIIADRATITPAKIEKEENAELRRIMLEIYGFGNYLSDQKAKLLSEDVDGKGHPRKLYQIKVGNEDIRVIELHNSSLEPDGSRRKFHLGAMPGATPHEAVAASFGFSPQHFREDVAT